MSYDQVAWAQIFNGCGVQHPQVDQWAPIFSQVIAGDTFDGGSEEIALFLGQVLHETGGLTTLAENFNYAADKLQIVFGSGRISAEDAANFGRTDTRPANQMALANILYGGTWGLHNLGNASPTDGWNYRGSGLIQVTGLYNFTLAQKRTDIPFVAQPELMRQVGKPALEASLAWWAANIGPEQLADQVALRKKVNAAGIGLADCIAYADKARSVLATLTQA